MRRQAPARSFAAPYDAKIRQSARDPRARNGKPSDDATGRTQRLCGDDAFVRRHCVATPAAYDLRVSSRRPGGAMNEFASVRSIAVLLLAAVVACKGAVATHRDKGYEYADKGDWQN